MQIHATNILGLGASQVVKSFLDIYCDNLNSSKTIIHLPSVGVLSKYKPKNGIEKKHIRFLPNGISRFIECYFSYLFFPNIDTIVLGDIPLRRIKNQIVLVHQPNLIYPKINPYSSKKIKFRINRFLFSINHKFSKKIIVQTGAMAMELEQSYPLIKSKIVVLPQPAPNWVLIKNKKIKRPDQKIILFYPSAFYPHKKHSFFLDLNKYINNNDLDLNDFEIFLTLNEKDFEPFKNIKFLKNLGKLSTSEMNNYYQKVDGLLFISSMESFGLPLIEALTLNLRVILVDLPYSRWVFEDKANYFQPYSEKSFIETLVNFKNDIKFNNSFDYSDLKNKFPEKWSEIVSSYLNLLHN